MAWIEAFEPVEKHYQDEVLSETWGHLAAKPRKKYSGTIYFCQAQDGTLVVIQDSFEPGGPWFYEHSHQLVDEFATEAGLIYKFTGTYTALNKTLTRYRFEGLVTRYDPVKIFPYLDRYLPTVIDEIEKVRYTHE